METPIENDIEEFGSSRQRVSRGNVIEFAWIGREGASYVVWFKNTTPGAPIGEEGEYEIQCKLCPATNTLLVFLITDSLT